jgi:hypothetical protein
VGSLFQDRSSISSEKYDGMKRPIALGRTEPVPPKRKTATLRNSSSAMEKGMKKVATTGMSNKKNL